MGGEIGRLLTILYTPDNSKYEDQVLSSIEKIISGLQTNYGFQGYSLGSGIGGVLALFHCIQSDNLIEDFDLSSIVDQLDEIVLQCTISDAKLGKLDYVAQVGGILNYYAIRAKSQGGNKYVEYINTVIPLVLEQLTTDEQGTRYKDNLLGKKDYNLSLAHGLSGLLHVLIKCLPFVEHKEELRGAIDRGLKYITKFATPDKKPGRRSIYPFSIDIESGELAFGNRLAWCYGDLNQLMLLELYKKTYSLNIYDDLIADLKQSLPQRDDFHEDLIDHSQFCHGTAGIACVYRYLLKLTQDSFYGDLYTKWIDITFEQISKDIQSEYYKGKEGAFLEGLSGSTLTLIQHDFPKRQYTINRFFLL